MVDRILSLKEGARIIILAPLAAGGRGACAHLLKRLKKEGFARVRIDGATLDLDQAIPPPARQPRHVELVVDRLVVKPSIRNRLADSLELALAQPQVSRPGATAEGSPVYFGQPCVFPTDPSAFTSPLK